MMAVIVDHQNPSRFALHFKPAMNAREGIERFGNMTKWNFQFMSDGNGRQRVGRAVPAR